MARQGESRKNSVLVVGGGVAGLQASVDLASSGLQVYLADRAAMIGGLMPQLDKTFPTNDCAMCLIAPKEEDRTGCLRGGVAVGRHRNITVLPNSDVQSVEGEAGNFRAVVHTRPRFIDPATCTACGKCAEVCPERAINEFNTGLEKRAAAYLTFPQAVPRVFLIDREACTECGLCAEVCPVGAVDFAEEPQTHAIEAGAVVLAVGNEVFRPSPLKQYLYGQHPNVISSLEYERIYSGTGPYQGRLERPSDGAAPKKIAWLQCIGSRDVHTHTYCSSVCCMYAIKEAIIAKERVQGVDTAIFYMDMRVCGKDYEQYYTRARENYGVRFICYRVPSLAPEGDGDLKVEYFDAQGKKQTEIFDMVVLSAGFEVSAQARELADRLRIDLDRHHYPRTDPFVPVASVRPGFYVCGTFQAPKDIPESVTEASAAAACCSALLGGPPPQTLTAEAPSGGAVGPPRLGVFLCGWGPDIDDLIDSKEVQEFAAGLPEVVLSAEHRLDCSPAAMAELAQKAAAAKVNRVVLAACSPMVNELRLKEAFSRVGINKYLVEAVNIRGEAAWVHSNHKAGATAKAKELLRAAAARVLSLKPLSEKRLPVEQQALVVGGGAAGMNAALNLAEQGYSVYLIEKAKQLGGLARRVHTSIEGAKVGDYLETLMQKVSSHPRLEILLETEIVRHLGTKGNFLTTVASGPERRERLLKNGAVILATGAREYRPTEYLYGLDSRVMTQLELEERLQVDPQAAAGWERVIMIQCVGSRNADNPNCSRICCQSAVKHALQLKEKAPDVDVVIFHRDVRLYGMLEDYYIEARDKKVLFERFDPACPPQVVKEGGRLEVIFRDNILERDMRWPVDAVILSAAAVAADTAELARILKVRRDEQGFWQEAHPKLRPVDLATEGYYVCGTGHSPKLIKEAVTQGLAAAVRAGAFLATTTQLISPIVSEVDQSRCVGCLACVRTCPYQIPKMDEKGRSVIDSALCLGCGVCAGVCPAQAIQFSHYTDEQLKAEMSA